MSHTAPPGDQVATEQEADPRRWLALGVLCLCLVLVVASVSSLNVAIPSIVTALGASQTEQLWILDAYALVFAGVLLPAGALGDRYGRKGALLVGLGIFAGAAVVASQASDPTQLIALRAVMGIGAALIMPATLSIITVIFPPHERGKAIAIWAGFAGAGGAIGPLASGILLEHFWWGSVFFINVPIVAVAFVAIAMVVPTSRDDERRPLDPVGALLSTGGLGALVFGIINGPEHGWTDPVTLGAFALAAAGLTAFVAWELRMRYPMLDPRLFRIRRFAAGSLTITAAFAVMFGMFFTVTLYLQFVQGHTPLEAAVRTLPFAITMLLVSPRGPRLVTRFGARRTIAGGLVVLAGGFVVASTLGPDTPYLLLAVALVMMATGLALVMPPSTEAIVSSLPPSKAGVGSAVNDTTREVGGAIGIALLGSLVSTGYRAGIDDAADRIPVPAAADAVRDSVAGAVGVGGRVGGELGARLVDVAGDAFTDGMQIAFLTAVGIVLLTAAAVLRLLRQPPPERDAAPTTSEPEVAAPGVAR